MQKMQMIQINERKTNSRRNVAYVVFSPEMSLEMSVDTDADLVEALEGKYDALRDKLLAEALIKQVRLTGLPLSTATLLVSQILLYEGCPKIQWTSGFSQLFNVTDK